MTQISSSIWLTVNITTALILTYVFINTHTHTHTHTLTRLLRSTSCSLALSSSSFVFSVSDSVLSVPRVSLGSDATSCAAISIRKHKIGGGKDCFDEERRRRGVFWWRETLRRAWRRSGARGWCGCRDVTKDSLPLSLSLSPTLSLSLSLPLPLPLPLSLPLPLPLPLSLSLSLSPPPERHSDVHYILLMINICTFHICKARASKILTG